MWSICSLAGHWANRLPASWLGRGGGIFCAGVISILAGARRLAFSRPVYTWIHSGSFQVNLSFQVDALTTVMLLVVTGIGFLIHVYSLGYMGHDDDMVRFFVYLNLFIFFMLLLVMADNLLLLFVGWEGVGLCSYLLIGFWYRDHNNTIAGNKAFIVNRIGDLGFIIGIFVLVTELGRQGIWTLNFSELQTHVKMLQPGTITLITFSPFYRRRGKIGADTAIRVVARRHGRSDAGERADPCRHHGDRRCLHDRTAYIFCLPWHRRRWR